MFDVLHFSEPKYLFGTSTLNDEYCVHALHQVEFMPSLVHKDRVQKTVLDLKLEIFSYDTM